MGESRRNLVAFWLLGLCNNFAYVIMLSAAKDILEVEEGGGFGNSTKPAATCYEDASDIPCSPISTGSVLLADIIPTLIIKLIGPFSVQKLPYEIRHYMIVAFQVVSYIIVAFSHSVFVGLIGVVCASISSGLGEITYLSLGSYFHNDAIMSWSSGTGGAGMFGSLTYAVLTDRHFIGVNPRVALLMQLVVPIILCFAFGKLLELPPNVARIRFGERRHRRGSVRAVEHASDGDSSDNSTPPVTPSDPSQPLITSNPAPPTVEFRKQVTQYLRLTKPLWKFIVPLTLVYFGEYFINQGLVELVAFDCAHGFGLNLSAQYRWYQVIYQFGVFVSRSSAKLVPLPMRFLPLLAVLQLVNAGLFLRDALHSYIPHIGIIFLTIFYEGLLGGTSYVNTFRSVHKTISEPAREFSMSFVTIADSVGIMAAGLLAIPVHNWICGLRKQ